MFEKIEAQKFQLIRQIGDTSDTWKLSAAIMFQPNLFCNVPRLLHFDEDFGVNVQTHTWWP